MLNGSKLASAENELKAEEHRKFWNREKTSRPIASFRIGNYFIATHYRAAEKILVKGTRIAPEMIDVDSFMEDYERQYQEVKALDQSGFWTAEPYPGIPWMEAFWGCEIIGNGESFISRPLVKDPSELEKLEFNIESPWAKKYFEFVVKLNKLSAGRFPVGAPILRGQADTLGALLGQTELIYALYEEPLLVRSTLNKIVDSFLHIYAGMHRLNEPFLGGSSIGFYHVWAPGESLWFQDDLSALLSPELHREFFLENEKKICEKYLYTMMHLHSASFHILDDVMCNENLKAIEINKDISGPDIVQMLDQFRKVLEKNFNLVICGHLTEEDIQFLYDKLDPRGIFFTIFLEDFQKAEKMNAFLKGMNR